MIWVSSNSPISVLCFFFIFYLFNTLVNSDNGYLSRNFRMHVSYNLYFMCSIDSEFWHNSCIFNYYVSFFAIPFVSEFCMRLMFFVLFY